MQWEFELEYDGIKIQAPEPVGWDAVSFEVKRDVKVFGLTFEFSTEVKWQKAGRLFIQDAYDTGNIDALVKVYVYRKISSFDEAILFYEGVLVMKDVRINDKFAVIRLEQSGFRKSFLGQKDLDVKLIPNKEVRLHSKTILNQSLFTVDDEVNILDYERIDYPPGDTLASAIYYLFPNNNELENINDNIEYIGDSYVDGVPSHFVEFANAGTVDISYRIKMQYRGLGNQPHGTNLVAIRYIGQSWSNIDSVVVDNFGGLFSAGANSLNIKDFDFGETLSVDVNKGDRLWLFFRFVTRNDNTVGSMVKEHQFIYDTEACFIDIKQATTTNSSTTQGLLAFDAFNQIINNYTGFENRFRSDFFENGCGKFCFLTSGFFLRALDDKDMFGSFEKLYDSFRVIFNLGFEVGNENGLEVVRVEPLSYFFSGDTELMYLKSPREVERTPALDYYYNRIDVGYKTWQDDAVGQVNGLDEFNSLRQYSTQITLGEFRDEDRNRKGLDLVVKDLITSGYLIEYMRRRKDKATTDSKFDNNLFLIMLNTKEVVSDRYGEGEQTYQAGSVSERNESFTISEVIDPDSIYNVRISPGRILRRWMPYISSQLIKDNANKNLIQFRSGEGNYVMYSLDTDSLCEAFGGFSEGDDIVADLESYVPIFEAEYLNFDFGVSFSQFDAVIANIKGFVRLDLGDKQVRGYIDTLDFEPKQASKLKLLRKYDN